jgi:lysophospholipase L1-like esterase
VLCLGDSLTFGARSEFVRGYPEELGRMLSNYLMQDWTCLNHGINGETSIDILRRAFPAVQSFAALPGAKLACLMAGTNDSKNPELPVDLYADNMCQIIRIFRRHSIKLLVGTLPPVKGNAMPCFDSNQSNQWIQKANIAIQDLVNENNLIPVDFSDMEGYLIDGVHFGYDGYKEMARRWFEKIKEL